jgi:uncharacterized protein (DUF934 family)
MPLVKAGKIVEDPFMMVGPDDEVPAKGGIIVDVERFQAEKDALFARDGELGVRLEPGQSPNLIKDDIGRLAVVAIAFPAFVDGRGYSYARLLRDRFGFKGEVRAVGDVLCEQLHFLARSGFDAFEIASANAAGEWKVAIEEITTWYQATGDGRKTVSQLRTQD